MNRVSRFVIYSCSALAVPSLGLHVYLRNHPLDASLSQRIVASETPTSSSRQSRVFREIINPRGHISTSDCHTITLPKTELGKISDEHILAAFTNGFFGGWMFVPERAIFATARAFGVRIGPGARFGDVDAAKHTIEAADLSSYVLPPIHARMFDGYFITMDEHIAREGTATSTKAQPSFIEIAYGDADKHFAGLHRFEVFRSSDSDESANAEEEVTISFSSFTCDPHINKLPFPRWAWRVHVFYARCLFRDGIREVLHSR